MLLILLLLLSSCSSPDFMIFKQKIEFKGKINKEYAYKVASYAANKLEFMLVKDEPYKTLSLIKNIKNKVEDDYKVKANEKLENSKQLILILGVSDEGYIIKPIIKKDLISINRIGRGKEFKDITDDEITSSEVKFDLVKEDTDEEKEILNLIETMTDILKIKKDVQKLKESELREEEKRVIPLPEGE